MSEYTFADLIANPEDPGLENLIGKEVYHSNVLLRCVAEANENIGVGILRGIRKGDYFPFYIETRSGRDSLNYACFACIIPKKEESEPKYVPFKNRTEFIKAYRSVETKKLRDETAYLAKHGMWLRQKCDSEDSMILSISPDGVFVLDTFYTWELLIKDFLFLDGSPCGRLKENK